MEGTRKCAKLTDAASTRPTSILWSDEEFAYSWSKNSVIDSTNKCDTWSGWWVQECLLRSHANDQKAEPVKQYL